MSAQVIDGEAIAAEIKEQIKSDIAALGKELHLHAVLAGDDFGAKFYAGGQQKGCEEVGIHYSLDQLPDDASQDDLAAHIRKLNDDPDCTGIICLMPVPKGVDGRALQQMIDPSKDVEGMHPSNMGKLFYNDTTFAPCTPKGCVELIKRVGCEVEGANVTVIGHSEIVGKPIAMLMLGLNATTTIVHVFTDDIVPHCKNADILISAAGAAGAKWNGYKRKAKKDPSTPLPDISPLVKADMIKPGAVVIDVAINRVPKGFDEDGKPIKSKKSGKDLMVTRGDVEYDKAIEVASHITPVPGGVGPMTVAMLLQNTVNAAKAAQ
ncbi:MAG: bifunctional 5,10-methylenetetrahydrofolate dehydrogenase/5,10-methenyltetrahydrofolate cyclohydrolase [Planctomycetes bacterium]|nr:bifunctional 5,10-methylenetetrahydrofolate dehydrogenase/5,10-methenyltetrahydrofolate cyclohydrolase [Planctomycetota bacterium]